MGAVTWKLRRAGGDERTFEAWGIRGAICRRSSLDMDTMEISFGRADLLGNLPFDPDEKLVIVRVEETAPDVFAAIDFFRGRLVGERRGAYGSSEALTLILAGPWWYLQKLIYSRPVQVVTDSTVNPAPANQEGLQLSDFPLVTKQISDIVLATDQQGILVDSQAMILDAIAYAIAKGAPIALGTIDAGIQIPREELRDATCAEVIQKALRWTPEQTAWWDYSVDPPALNIRTRENRDLVELDVADEEITQVEINPRRDLMINGVTLNYLRRHQRTDFEFITVDQDQAGPDPLGLSALVNTIELFGSYLIDDGNGTLLIVAQEPAPAGLAAALYNSYKDPAFEGRVLIVADDVPSTPWLSKTLRVLNGAPAWAVATMDLQQSSDDLFSGRTELTIGPPRQLGALDLVGLVRKGRTKPPPLLGPGGGGPNVPPFSPTTPDPRLVFSLDQKPEIILHVLRGRDIGFPGGFGTFHVETLRVFTDHTETTYHDIVATTVGAIGSTSTFHGFRVGRGQDVRYDMPNASLPSSFPPYEFSAYEDDHSIH